MTEINCPSCKKSISADSEFCYHCGHSFKSLAPDPVDENNVTSNDQPTDKGKSKNFLYWLPIIIIAVLLSWKFYFKDVFNERMKEKAVEETINDFNKDFRNNDQLWTEYTIHSVSFKSPSPISKQETNPTQNFELQETYQAKTDWISIFGFYAKGNLTDYQIKTGLEGGMTNMVRELEGTDLKTTDHEPRNKFDDIYISGYFNSKNQIMRINGFGYKNNNNEFIMIVAISPSQYSDLTDKFTNSITIND